MKKIIALVAVTALLLSLAACGLSAPKGKVTTEVTWEELLAANNPRTVLPDAGSVRITTVGTDDEAYYFSVALDDGELKYANGPEGYTEDLIDGILYQASSDGMGKSVTILAPTADLYTLVENNYSTELESFDEIGDVHKNEENYWVHLRYEDDEWGFVTEGYAYFDLETLFLERMEIVQSLGIYKARYDIGLEYGLGAGFETVSYDRLVSSDNTVDLTIHYPDGTAKDIKVDRGSTIITYYPDHAEQWSACWDEACTASIDDLAWISGDHGDIYICEGDVVEAPPTLSKVLENSVFDIMFMKNYNSYIQNIYVNDEDDNTLGVIDIAWYLTEEKELRIGFDQYNSDYEVVKFFETHDNVLYYWSEEEGYAIDFSDDLTYAESLVSDYLISVDTEALKDSELLMPEGGYAYYIPYEVTTDGSETLEYKYWIHTDMDYIDRVEIFRRDESGNFIDRTECYIGGGGPFPGEKDVYTEITEPEDASKIKLTVVFPDGERTYSVRSDAKISHMGGELYRDEACLEAVTDLSWVSGGSAKVFVK